MDSYTLLHVELNDQVHFVGVTFVTICTVWAL
jgi:hypothetical protein